MGYIINTKHVFSFYNTKNKAIAVPGQCLSPFPALGDSLILRPGVKGGGSSIFDPGPVKEVCGLCAALS